MHCEKEDLEVVVSVLLVFENEFGLSCGKYIVSSIEKDGLLLS